MGLLYSTSEVNSGPAIEAAKAYLDEKGIAYLDKTGNTTDEMWPPSTPCWTRWTRSLPPTDNVVMNAELAIAPTLAEAGIPHYAGADSFVRNGAFATCGVNYTDLGAQTADLAVEVLETGEVPAFITVAGDIITVNTDTAAALGLDYSMLEDMGSSLVEVQTHPGVIQTMHRIPEPRPRAGAPAGKERAAVMTIVQSALEAGFLYRPHRPGPLFELFHFEHRRHDHRRGLRPGVRGLGGVLRGRAPHLGPSGGHAGRRRRGLYHGLSPDPAGVPSILAASSPTSACTAST